MLDPQLVKALSKVYKDPNYERDCDKDVRIYTKPDSLSKKHNELLATSNFAINQVTQDRHDA